MMIRYIVLCSLVLVGCGREKKDVHTQQDREALEEVQNSVSYDKKSYRNIYLRKKIEDVNFTVKEEGYTETINVEVKPTCFDHALRFTGEKPQGPFVQELDLVSGSTNIRVFVKCQNEGCSKFILSLKEDRDGEKGMYPILAESKEGLWVKKWSPNKQADYTRRELEGENYCFQNDVVSKKTVRIFQDFDQASDSLGFFERNFSTEAQAGAATDTLIQVCESDLGGTVKTNSIGTVLFNFTRSLRMSLNTMQFEYDDFVYGECVIDSNTSWRELPVYSEGSTKESALKKAQRHCTNDLGGYVDSHYQREVHKVSGSNKWIAKLACHAVQGEEFINF